MYETVQIRREETPFFSQNPEMIFVTGPSCLSVTTWQFIHYLFTYSASAYYAPITK